MGIETRNLVAFLGTRKDGVRENMVMFHELFDEILSEVNTLPDKRQWLKNLFKSYRFMKTDHPVRLWLDSIISLHQEYCTRGDYEHLIRQHNSFVMFYMTEKKYSLNQVARMNNVVPRTICRNIVLGINRLLVFTFGIGGIPFV